MRLVFCRMYHIVRLPFHVCHACKIANSTSLIARSLLVLTANARSSTNNVDEVNLQAGPSNQGAIDIR